MLTLTQVGCSSILANSDVIQEFIQNPCLFEKIDLEVGMNCCGTTHTETIQIPQVPGCSVTEWHINIPKGQTTLVLNNMKFRNLLTGSVFTVPAGSLPITAPVDLVNFVDVTVDTFFFNNTGSTPGTIKGLVGPSAIFYELTILNLPTNFAAVSTSLTVDGLDVEIPFTYWVSGKNTLFTAAGILLQPDIIGADAFPDGVYKVKVTLWRPSGSRVAQQNCLFFDCNTACKVSADLDTATPEEQTELLMLHYGLTKGSNCACDCETLCKMYQRLHTLLTNTEISDCGC
jgi:hypothetical protein